MIHGASYRVMSHCRYRLAESISRDRSKINGKSFDVTDSKT